MKLKVLLSVAGMWLTLSASAQNYTQQVTALQYYFDTDPGVGIVGNGAILPVTPSANYNETVSITVPGSLSAGFHNLYVRAKDEFGKWSVPERRLFYINTATSTVTQDIIAYQYYFDTDPGVGVAGNGAIVPVTQTSNFNASVSITAPGSLTTGFHNLYVRTLDLSGRWSLIERRLFYINSASSAITQDITAYQYYFDTDPGVGVTGNGAIVPVTQTSNYNELVSITVPSSLSTGFHNLYVRTRDVLGRWSLIERRLFYINTATSSATQEITAYQYYFDTDPGVGIAGNGAIVPVTQTSNYNELVSITVPGSLTSGFHNLYVRTRDVSGRWSVIERRLFYINTASSSATQDITAYQYYFDTDPGVGVAGNGVIVPVTQTPDYNEPVTIPVPGTLATGFHNLYVRTRDVLGHWSLIERRLFYINTGTSLATQDITALEFYYDNDPGVGNGNTIPVTTAASINATFSVSVPCLSTGTHYLYVRAKDAAARWSIIERDTITVTSGISASSVTPAGPVSICASDSATLTANLLAGVTYQWLLNGSNIPGATSNSYVVHAAGNYSLKTTCGSSFVTSNVVVVTIVPLLTFYADTDGDGFGNLTNTTQACTPPSGYVSNSTDCNDTINAIHPGATELCNGIDEDCDGQIDEGVQTTFYADADGDSYGNLNVDSVSCTQPAGYVSNSADCNDANPGVHPGVIDILGNGIDEDCNGSDAQPASALHFDGVNDEIIVANNAHYFEHPAFTFECWVKKNNAVTAAGRDRLMVSQNDGGWGVAFNPDGTIFISFVGFSGVNSTGTVTNTNWHHIAVTHDGSTAKFYIDGNAAGTVAYPVTFSSLGNYGIGNRPGRNEYLDGSMDEVRVWKVVRAPSEILANMNCEINFTHPNLIANYHFNQGIANANNSGIISLADSSGHAHNGTLTGFTLTGNTSNWVHPGGVTTGNFCSPCIPSPEICNGFDDDCDGLTDDADPDVTGQNTWYIDADGDGFGNATILIHACIQPSGYVADSTDCNDSNNAIHPGGNPGIVSGASPLCIGATTTFSSNGDGGGSWSSSNTNVASIAPATGLVTVMNAGTTNITYTVTGCNISVNASKVLTVNPVATAGTITGTATLCIGAATIYSSNGTSGGTWSSSDTLVATVSRTNGVVSALSAGTANIVYTVTGCGGTFTSSKIITVSAAVSTGTIAGPSLLCIGETPIFTSNGTAGGTWSSSNSFIASVNGTSGQLTALSPGAISIIYTVAGCNGSASTLKPVSVISVATAGTVTGASILCVGGTSPYGSNGTPGGSWHSTDTSVATVGSISGIVTALSEGSTNIIYTISVCGNTFTSGKPLTVGHVVDAGTVSIIPPLCIGETTTLTGSGTAGGSWHSSDSSIASVNSSTGLLTAVNPGIVSITYSITGCNGSFSSSRLFTVISVATAGTIGGATPLCIGSTSPYNSNGTTGGTWSSSNNGVATVDSSTGLVATLNAGTTTISYTVTGCGNIYTSSKLLIVAGHPPVFSFSGNIDFTSSVVFPTEGEQFNSFRFEVMYTDVDGDLPAPGFPRLMLDFENNGLFSDPGDMNITMAPVNAADLNVTDGKIYSVTLFGLALGTDWTANFYAQATGGCEAHSVSFSGPDVISPPELSIFADDITFSDNHPAPSSTITVFAVIHNDSPQDVNNVFVHLINQYDTSQIYPDVLVPILPADTSIQVSWSIMTPVLAAWVPMQVVVDYTDVIEETNELDNQAIRPFTNGPFVVPGNIKITAGGPPMACQNSFFSVCGRAVYRNTAVVLQNPSVAGALVSLTVIETGQIFTGLTNSFGNYCISFLTSADTGTYTVEVSVTDFTITGDTTFSFSVIYCPPPPPPVGADLTSEITLDAGEVFSGNPITGTVKIKNVGNQPGGISIGEVYLNSTGPGLAQQFLTPALAPGESHTASFSLISLFTSGSETVNSMADATNLISEIHENNNDDHEAIRICPLQPDLTAGGPLYIRQIYLCENTLGFSIGNFTCLPVTDSFDIILQVFQNSILANSERRTIAGIGRDAGMNFSFNNIFPASGEYLLLFTVDINNSVGEFNESNNTYSAIFTVLDCKPELSISAGCSPVTPADPSIPGNISVHTTLTNGGKADAIAPFVVDFEVAGNHYPVMINSTLPAHSTVPVIATFPTPPYGCAMATVKADATNVIDEYTEENQIEVLLSWDFSLGRQCYEFDPEDPQPNPNFWEVPHGVGEPILMSVGLINHSTYTASLVTTRFEVSGPGITGWLDLGSANTANISQSCYLCKTSYDIAPHKVTLPNSFVFPDLGIYQVRMTTDQNNFYTECNENNNVKIVDVTITNLPDYRTLSRYIAPSLLNPEVGEPISIDVTYQNIGPSDLVDSLDILVRVDNLPHETVRVKGLLSGSTFTAHCTNQWASLRPGLHIIRAIVDSRHEIQEPDEFNNEATRSFVVGKAANLYFQVFSPDNSFPLPGQPISINARIGNSGALASQADVKFYYLDDFLDTVPIGSLHVNVGGKDSVTISFPWNVLDNSTTLIGRIENFSILQIRYDNKEATAPLEDFNVTLASTPACLGGNNGILVANAFGGSPPFTFTWSTGDTGAILSAPQGIYTVSVGDAAGSTRVKEGRIVGLPPPSFFEDADGDGYGNPASITEECICPAGYVIDNTDCNDANDNVNPGATEVCNSVDDNCNGQIDEGVLLTCYIDEDADNFGNLDISIEACSVPAGYVSDSTDCNDAQVNAHPGATEICNGLDDNCNGQIDEGVSQTYYQDADGDGFGNPDATTQECNIPSGFVTNNTDCNDNPATGGTAIHPGATEVCNSIDDNCNGLIDEGVLLTFFRDADGDGFGNPVVTVPACFPPPGFVVNNTDCNDANTAVHPGATEICNNVDDNCDGQIDEGVLLTFFRDSDGDNFGNSAVMIQACTAPVGFVSNNTDCNDALTAVHPGAAENCSNNTDDNCNGQVNEGCVVCSLTVNAGIDEQTFYGYTADQIVTHVATASGGMAPYSYSWSLNRPLICNQVNAAGDELFSGGICINNSCGSGAAGASIASCSGSASVSAKLLANAIVCLTVTDARGCTARDSFNIISRDARCFAGNSGNTKVLICHRTSSNTNPWVQICVSQSAVPAHMAQNGLDYFGMCGSLRLADQESSDAHGISVYPNPAHNKLTVEFYAQADGKYHATMCDITGRTVIHETIEAKEGDNNHELDLHSVSRGIYIISITNEEGSKQVKVIVE